MKTFYLIIDESGAKGYSENTEKYLQEFGVMVGFLVPSEYLMVWRSKSEKIFEINKCLIYNICSINS